MEISAKKTAMLQNVVAWVMVGVGVFSYLLNNVFFPMLTKSGSWELYLALATWVDLVFCSLLMGGCFFVLGIFLARNVSGRVFGIIALVLTLLNIPIAFLFNGMGVPWGIWQVKYVLFNMAWLYIFSILLRSNPLSRTDVAWIGMLAISYIWVIFYYLIDWVGGGSYLGEVFNRNYIGSTTWFKVFSFVLQLMWIIGYWRLCRSAAFSGGYVRNDPRVRLSPFNKMTLMFIISIALMAVFMLLLFYVFPDIIISILS